MICNNCLLEYEVRQNDALIQRLYSDGDPQEYALLTRVRANRIENRYSNKQIRGALALLDRGIVFIEISRLDPRRHFAIVSSQLEELGEREYDHASVSVLEGAVLLREILERAPRLYFYPVDGISKMKYSRLGRKKLRFRCDREKLEFQMGLLLEEDEDIIRKYVSFISSS